MKKNLMKFSKVAWLVLMALAIISTSCKKDDDEPAGGDDPVIVLDGVYVKGDATALTDFDTKGQMKITINEVTNADRAELLELYIAVKATGGFNIVTVAGSSRITYGPGDDFAVVPEAELNGEEPQNGLQRGSVKETDTKFTVPEDGLYHVVYDTELQKVAIAKVDWGIIGAATPGGWTSDSELAPEGFDLNTITFKATDVTLVKGDFKFRYSKGWKIILDTDVIKVNTNFGNTVDELVPGGNNIIFDERGIYTVSLVWTLGSDYVATLTKTGDLEISDYTNTELGLVGNAIMVDGNVVGWNTTVMSSVPVVTDETTYTWTYSNVEVLADSGFKIREGQDWSGKIIGFTEVEMGGTAAADFVDDGGNFKPVNNGHYDMELIIDAVTEKYTFNVNVAGSAAVLYVVGSHQNWDPSTAPTIEESDQDGIFEGSVEFTGDDIQFKFTSLPSWDGTNYGAGNADGELSTDGAAGNLTLPAAGTYDLVVDINNLTWEFTAQK